MAYYRFREIPVTNNSILEYTIFGRPVTFVVNVVSFFGMFLILCMLALFAVSINWYAGSLISNILTGLSFYLFLCAGFTPHILLIMAVQEGDGNLIGSACYGYGILLGVEAVIVIFEIWNLTDSRKAHMPNLQLIVYGTVHFAIGVLQIAIGALFIRCAQFFRIKEREKRLQARVEEQERQKAARVAELRTAFAMQGKVKRSSFNIDFSFVDDGNRFWSR